MNKRLEKLEKVIEILKDMFEFEVKQYSNEFYYMNYCVVLNAKIENEEDAILLKEILND